MTRINTIADVIAELDLIVKECVRTQSRAGYFAALYKRMTMAVAQGIHQRRFENGTRMEALDIIFAQRYLSAYAAFQKGEECTTSWRGAFRGCNDDSLIVLQQMILGINTHINLDLAIAAAEVAPGGQIHTLRNDFNRINDVIASLFDDVQQCLEQVWFPVRFIKRVSAGREEAVLNFNIGIARKTAWANAVLLAGMNEAQKTAHIQTMDKMVWTVGDRIINPGFWPKLLLRIIRLTEYDDVARTIHLIDTTVVDNHQVNQGTTA